MLKYNLFCCLYLGQTFQTAAKVAEKRKLYTITTDKIQSSVEDVKHRSEIVLFIISNESIINRSKSH